jgi:hypothetical protein
MALLHPSQSNNAIKNEYEVLLPRKIGSRDGYLILKFLVKSARQNVTNYCNFSNKTSQQDPSLIFTSDAQVILKNTVMNRGRSVKTCSIPD